VDGTEPSDVAARAREALHQALSDRIDHEPENDWYGARLLLQRFDRGRGACENSIRRQSNEFRRISFEKGRIAPGKAVADLDILAFDPPETPKSLPKGPSHSPERSRRTGTTAETRQHGEPARAAVHAR
jgi:hypothetical protein